MKVVDRVVKRMGGMSWAGVAAVLLCAGTAAAAEPEAAEAPKLAVRVGASMIPLEVGGLADVHASDWQNYGTGSSEGRVSVPLGGGNSSIPVAFGPQVGISYKLMGRTPWSGGEMGHSLDIVADFAFYFSDMMAFTAKAGVDWFFLDYPSWRLGISPQIGFLYGFMSFGEVEVLPGKTPPVITPIGTFNEGDELKASMGMLLIDAGLKFEYDFTRNWGLRVAAGFQYGFPVMDFKVEAGDVELDMDAPALVKTDGSTTQAGLNPEAKSLGASVFLGAVYRF